MRSRLVFTFVLLALFGATLGVSAHEQDAVGQQTAEFAATAAKAAEHSNAPASHTPCVKGYAGEFPCDGIDMLSYTPSADLGVTFVNDIWGWTDPETGTDYALVGAAEGMIIVDVSDAKRPVVVGTLPTASTVGGEFWRDIKVYQDHAFVVSEYDDHGMQVLDLTQVRDVDLSGGPVTFADTARYDGIGHSHNVAINEDTGYAYVVGADSCAGGLHMVDISDPANPTFAGCGDQSGYIHDTQCVVYEGPDADYQGHELCFSAAAEFLSSNTVSIIDVTDKANPVLVANAPYGVTFGYSHQGWLTPDQGYYLHGDELDELFGTVATTTTRIWDVRDLDNPVLLAETTNGNTSIDHNIYVDGRYAYASNYTSGLRVFDARDIADGELPEVAYFDLYPENDNASFEGGTWSNYPFFSQKGLVAVTSMDRGLFLLQPRLGRNGA